MLKHSYTIGLLTAVALIIAPTAVQAQISQQGSEGASASGEGSRASSHVRQSARQRVFGDCNASSASPTQTIVQEANANAIAVGENATAANRVGQSANQNILVNGCGARSVPSTQIIRQEADVSTFDAP